MNKIRFLTVLIMSASITLFLSPYVCAWNQTMTEGENPIPISWKNSCFYYSINERGSEDIPLEELKPLIRDCFDTWENVSCSHFKFFETDFAEIDEVTFNIDNPNVNLLVWRERASEWPHQSTVIAMTSINYDEKTGTILDVDIEFNGVNCIFADQDQYPDDTELIDLRNTLTHEIGHTIGLDHNLKDPTATMYGWGAPGSTEKRSLTADDMDGICTIYPVDEEGICRMPYCGLGLTQADDICDDDLRWPIRTKTSGCTTSPQIAGTTAGLFTRLYQLFVSARFKI